MSHLVEMTAQPSVDVDVALGTIGYLPATGGLERSYFAAPINVPLLDRYTVPSHVHFPISGWSASIYVSAEAHGAWTSPAEEYDRLVARWQRWAAEHLAEVWEEANVHRSAVRAAVRHPAFAALARLGSVGLYVALQRLTTQHRPLWIMFLQTVTNERPAAGTESITEAADAWRQWGRQHGLLA